LPAVETSRRVSTSCIVSESLPGPGRWRQQRNAALVEEAAAAAASMERQSEGLEPAVAAFKLDGGKQFA
jgi:hypothetical protein